MELPAKINLGQTGTILRVPFRGAVPHSNLPPHSPPQVIHRLFAVGRTDKKDTETREGGHMRPAL